MDKCNRLSIRILLVYSVVLSLFHVTKIPIRKMFKSKIIIDQHKMQPLTQWYHFMIAIIIYSFFNRKWILFNGPTHNVLSSKFIIFTIYGRKNRGGKKWSNQNERTQKNMKQMCTFRFRAFSHWFPFKRFSFGFVLYKNEFNPVFHWHLCTHRYLVKKTRA